jgi:ubiquinone/menaquinone biosynthesis C-methylase UbiE
VTAVDSSEKIAAFGVAKAQKNHLNNLEFLQGDLHNPHIEAMTVDLDIAFIWDAILASTQV